MKKIMIIALLAITASCSNSTGSRVKTKTCNERLEIIASVRNLAPQYFKNPKSFDLDQKTVKIASVDDKMYVRFYAYAQNGFGGTQRKGYTMNVEKLPGCKYRLTNLR